MADQTSLLFMNTPNPTSDSLSRRDFIARAGLGAAAAYLAPATAFAAAAPTTTPAAGGTAKYDISFLEKWHFDGGDASPEQIKYKYTPEQTAQVCDEIGLDIELTVRKVGHITPEKVPDELPVMVAALAKKGRKISYLAMDTVRPDEPHWEKALRVAKQLGITRYRHRGFQYDLTKSRKLQIPNMTAMARQFAAVNKDIGMQAVYQIHAQPRMAGSAAWDLDMILADIDPKYFGVAFDTQHVLVEQGLSYINAVDVLAPRTVALCVKSFRWEEDPKTKENRPLQVPLGQGFVKKTHVTSVIDAHGGPLPLIIHIEHFKNAKGELYPSPFEKRKAIVDAFRSDAKVLREWLNLPAT
jgi:sugar phosphate isomerase/epimerase